MSNVISFEAYRRAIFRGSRQKPVYDPHDIPTERPTCAPAEIDALIASFDKPDDAA